MYVMGGNDLSETFGDLWRISLESIMNYAEKQWDMENKMDLDIEIERNRIRGNVVPLIINSDDYDKNNIGVGVGKISRRGSSDVCAVQVQFKYPVWENLCKNCSLVGMYTFTFTFTFTRIIMSYNYFNLHILLLSSSLLLSL